MAAFFNIHFISSWSLKVDGNALKRCSFYKFVNCVGLVFSERLRCGILHVRVNTDLLLNIIEKYEKSRVFVSFRTYCLCCVLEEYSLLIVF